MDTRLKLFSPKARARSQQVSKIVPDAKITPVIRWVIDIIAGSWNRQIDKCGDKGRGRDIFIKILLNILIVQV